MLTISSSCRKAELADLSPEVEEPPPQQPAPSPPKQPAPAAAPSPAAAASSSGDMVSVVQDRLEMYQRAQSAAVQAGESSKARRMDRGIKVGSSLVVLAGFCVVDLYAVHSLFLYFALLSK